MNLRKVLSHIVVGMCFGLILILSSECQEEGGEGEEGTEAPEETTEEASETEAPETNNAAIDQLNAKIDAMEQSLLQRIQNLEGNYYNALSDRVTALETSTPTKFTELENKLHEELAGLAQQCYHNLTTVEAELKDAIKTETDLKAQIAKVGTELRGEIAKFNGRFKPYNKLLKYHEVWRQNFRNINATLMRFKRRMANQG